METQTQQAIPQSQKLGITLIMGAVLLLIGAALGYYVGYDRGYEHAGVTVSPTPSESAASAGWRFYRNTQFEFSFAYPPPGDGPWKWQLHEETHEAQDSTKAGVHVSIEDGHNQLFSFMVNPFDHDFCLGAEDERSGTRTISGIQSRYTICRDSSGYTSERYQLSHRGNDIVISFGYANDEQKDLAHAVLESVRFE